MKVFRYLTWQFENDLRKRPRWSKWHATEDRAAQIDQGLGATLCGKKIPSDPHTRIGPTIVQQINNLDCDSCIRSIQKARDLGEW